MPGLAVLGTAHPAVSKAGVTGSSPVAPTGTPKAFLASCSATRAQPVIPIAGHDELGLCCANLGTKVDEAVQQIRNPEMRRLLCVGELLQLVLGLGRTAYGANDGAFVLSHYE